MVRVQKRKGGSFGRNSRGPFVLFKKSITTLEAASQVERAHFFPLNRKIYKVINPKRNAQKYHDE